MSYLSGAGGDPNFLGYFATPSALISAYPIGFTGAFAVVGSTDTIWVWDDTSMSWVDTGTSLSLTLNQVSINSTTAPNSVYQMTSGVPVNFKTSDTNSLLYLDDTNKTVGIRKTSSLLALSVQGTNAGASSSGSSENGAIRVLGAGTNAILDIGIVGSGAHSWLQVRDSSNYATTYNLALQPTGGGVMIGTISRVSGNKLTVVNSSAPEAGFFASSSSVVNINSISDSTQIVLSTGAGSGTVRGYLGADSVNAFKVWNSSASTALLKVVNATGVLEVGSGFYANQSLMSIGAALTGGYNGSYGIYNARGGLIDINRFFVGENNNAGGISTMELRGLGSSTGTRTMGRFNVNSYTVAGNYTGTSLAIASTTHIDSSNTGYSGTASGTLVSTSGAKIDIIGTTSTNYGERLDSIGKRVGFIQALNNTNTVPFQVDVGDVASTTVLKVANQTNGYAAIYFLSNATTVTANNYSIFGDGQNTYLNAASGSGLINFRIGGGTNTKAYIDTNNLNLNPNVGLYMASGGTNNDLKLIVNSTTSNIASGAFYPGNGTNVASTYAIIPKGTGNGVIMGQFALFNTDFVANTTNYETLLISSRSTQYSIFQGLGGTGALRPLILNATSTSTTPQIYLKTDGTSVGINNNNPLYTLDVNGQIGTKNVIYVNNAITASTNAATVPITSRLNTVTNDSAATITITLTTTSAVDGQMMIVRVLDFSAIAQTIVWVNTENSSISVPTTSNGSTTLPLTVGFMFNSATSKWRCVAKA